MWKNSILTSSHLDNKISWESSYRVGTEPVSSSSYKRIGYIKQGLKFTACQWYCQKVLDARTNVFINGPERINCKKSMSCSEVPNMGNKKHKKTTLCLLP